jgi:hypothetical protein
LYVDDAEFRTAAEAARRSLERNPIPGEEVQSPPPPPAEVIAIEPVAHVPEPKLRVGITPAWRRALSLVKARRKLWMAGVIGGLAVLPLLAVLFIHKKPPPPPPPPKNGILEITTSPAGAAVLVNGKPRGTAAAALQLSLVPGPVEIEARSPGYQTKKVTVNLAGGARLAVPLNLVPVVALRLQFPAEGQVGINDEEPVTVQDGQFLRELPVGAYSVKFSTGRTSKVAFTFEVRSEGPAVITGTPSVQGVSALLISNFGDQTRINTGASSVDVSLDGRPLGQLDKSGLELPKLSPSNHELVLRTGANVRKHTIEISPERSLTVIIESDPNTGTLLVQTNEENAAIVVLLANGKEVKHGNSGKGPLRVSNLKAGTYLVRASKDGYDADFTEQLAEVQKGEDKTVSFQFRPRPLTASVRVRLTPGSELFVDGSSMGVIQEDNRTVPGLKAGEHTLRAEKGRQYQPNQKPVELSAGQTSDLDLRLAILPVPVEITKRPADSIVTYTRAGDATVRTVTGTRLELPEGNYTFRADAKGYLQKIVTNEHVSWDSIHPIDLTQAVAPRDFTMADWDKGFWTPKNGSFEGKAGVFILFPKQLSFVQFAVRTQGVKTYAHWILHYVNEENYI